MTEPAAPAKKSTPRKTWVKIMGIGAVAVVLALINIGSNTEAPAQAVALLQYLCLGLGAVGFVGGLIGVLSTK
jgi:hypothetical protein